MLFVVRCYTCGTCLSNRHKKYIELKDDPKVFEKIKLKRYCCRKFFITFPDMFSKIFKK